MIHLILTIFLYGVVLLFVFAILNGLMGNRNSGQLISGCISVLILYMLVVSSFGGINGNGVGIFSTGIPFLNNIEQYGTLKLYITQAPYKFALDFVQLVTLTLVINAVSNLLTFEKSGICMTVISRIIIVLVALMAYGMLMDTIQNSKLLSWTVYAVECLITEIAIVYTPVAIISHLTGMDKNGKGVSAVVSALSSSNVGKAISNAISGSITFLAFIFVLENEYGSIRNVVQGVGDMIVVFGVCAIELMGIYFLVKNMVK